CFDKAKEEEKKNKRKIKKYHELEQVRFIMTAPNGEIRDLPWERWNLAEKNINDETAEEGNIRLDFTKLCCDKPDLRYLRSETFADLAGIRVKCENKGCDANGREVNLSGLFGLRIGNDKNKQFKPVIRTSNS